MLSATTKDHPERKKNMTLCNILITSQAPERCGPARMHRRPNASAACSTALELALLLLTLTAAAPHLAAAQAPGGAEPVSAIETTLALLQTEGLENSQLMETLSWLTDVSGGRLTNSPSMHASVEWIESRLADWGIERVWREPWGPFGQGWTNDRAWARIAEPNSAMILMNVEPWTGETNGIVRGPAVLAAGIATGDDIEQYRGKLKNAFVLISEPPAIEPPVFEPLATRHSVEDLLRYSWPRRPPPPNSAPAIDPERMAELRKQFAAADRLREIGLEFFAEEGAAAVLVAGRGTGGAIFLNTTYYRVYGPRRVAPLPVLTVASEHYGRITRMLEKGVPVVLEAEIANSLNGSPDDPSFNLLAELPGSDKADEVVMLGAHLDGFPYATSTTDNAANVAVMMEAMRILKATGVPLRRTVRMALWTGEEQGLYGSSAYVHDHFVDSLTNEKKPDFDRLAAYYNLDNGGGAIRAPMVEWDLQPDMQVDSTFRAWTLQLDPELGVDIVAAQTGGGSDHVSFFVRGLPGFQFLQDWLEYSTRTHHTNMDTYERVVPEDVRRNAVIVASFVMLTANQDELFPRMITRFEQQ